MKKGSKYIQFGYHDVPKKEFPSPTTEYQIELIDGLCLTCWLRFRFRYFRKYAWWKPNEREFFSFVTGRLVAKLKDMEVPDDTQEDLISIFRLDDRGKTWSRYWHANNLREMTDSVIEEYIQLKEIEDTKTDEERYREQISPAPYHGKTMRKVYKPRRFTKSDLAMTTGAILERLRRKKNEAQSNNDAKEEGR